MWGSGLARAWEKIGRAVGAQTVLVIVGDHDRIVAFERLD